MNFRENPSSVSKDVFMQTDGRTDRYDKANSRFSQLCERTYILVRCNETAA